MRLGGAATRWRQSDNLLPRGGGVGVPVRSIAYAVETVGRA